MFYILSSLGRARGQQFRSSDWSADHSPGLWLADRIRSWHILDTARNINQHTSSFNPAGHLLHPSYIRLTTSSTQFSEFLDIKDQVIQIFDIWQQVGTQINFDVLLLIAPEPLTRKSSISFSQSIKFLVKQTSTFIRFYIVYVRSCIKTSCELLWH